MNDTMYICTDGVNSHITHIIRHPKLTTNTLTREDNQYWRKKGSQISKWFLYESFRADTKIRK